MMRFIKFIFLISLAVVLIASTAVFILFQVVDTDKYLLKVTTEASHLLGRNVSVGRLGLGLSFRGITLDAWPVTIADDQDFTKQSFIRVDRIRIGFDVRSLIVEHRFRVSHIILQSPQIHIIRSQQGQFNFHALGQSSQIVDVQDDVSSNASKEMNEEIVKNAVEGSPTKEQSLLDALRTIRIQDGSISYIDQDKGTPLDLWLRNINVVTKDFSISKPFHLSVEASFYSHIPNLKARVTVSNLGRQEQGFNVDLNDLRLKMDFSHLDLDGLKFISPKMTDDSYLRDMAGVLQLNMDHASISSSKLLEAKGETIISDGIIKNLNVVKLIFSETLGSFGLMGANIDNLFNGHLTDGLDAEDTLIEKGEARFSYHDQTLFIDNFLVQTNIFEFTSQGTIDQALNVDMQTSLHLNPEASNAFVDQFKGFKYLMDDSNRITINASLKGDFPHLKYKPSKDFRKKGKRALLEEGGNILGVLLGGKHE